MTLPSGEPDLMAQIMELERVVAMLGKPGHGDTEWQLAALKAAIQTLRRLAREQKS